MQLQAFGASPLITIWLKPRETIRSLLLTNQSNTILLFGALAGIEEALRTASAQSTDEPGSLLWVLVRCIVGGAIGGLVSLWVGGWFYGWLGRLLGGKGSGEDMRTAVAWAQLPVVVLMPRWLLLLLLFGEENFTQATPGIDASPVLGWLWFGLSTLFWLAMIALGIWSAVILVVGASEVHGFSVGRAVLATMALPIVGVLAIALIVLCILAAFVLGSGSS